MIKNKYIEKRVISILNEVIQHEHREVLDGDIPLCYGDEKYIDCAITTKAKPNDPIDPLQVYTRYINHDYFGDVIVRYIRCSRDTLIMVSVKL